MDYISCSSSQGPLARGVWCEGSGTRGLARGVWYEGSGSGTRGMGLVRGVWYEGSGALPSQCVHIPSSLQSHSSITLSCLSCSLYLFSIALPTYVFLVPIPLLLLLFI